MCHSWQYHLSTKHKKTAYHDNEWARFMKSVGLIPSDTGKPGGKMTGQGMTHYIEEGGRFDLLTDRLLSSGWRLNYLRESDPEPVVRKKRETKTKYSCPECGVNAWGKIGINLVCDDCEEAMVAQ